MRSVMVLVAGLVAAGAVAVQAQASGHEGRHENAKVLEWSVMTPVSEPFTGAANPVRGLPGGGLPWVLRRAKGKLRSDGRLDVRVEGLVLARRAPVPAPLRGTNPVPQFRAVVSCLTRDAAGTGVATVNRFTNPVPATPDGDARIRARVALPAPCVAPVVFVTSPAGAWFASTGG